MDLILYFFTAYTILKIYISVMQIGFISQHLSLEPVLMDKDGYIKAGRYGIRKERLSIIESLVEFAAFIFWLSVGLEWLNGFFPSQESPLFSALLALSFFVIGGIFSLPLEIYKSFYLDKEFGFSTITPKVFLLDTVKSLAMTLILGGLVAYLLSYIIFATTSWWFYGFLLIFAVILFVNFFYPTLIAPIFNKFHPLENKELATEIDSLLKKSGFKSSGVFVIDASKRDNRLNAYFGGLGKSKRVVLFDSLLEKLTNRELLAVLGHELGHFKHGDIYKNIAIMGFVMFVIFATLGNIPEDIFYEIGISDSAGNNLALISLLASPLSLFFMPLIGYFSRKNEFAADEYGSSSVDKKSLIDALIKLVKENSSFPRSHPIYIFFHYTHPPILERLKALGYEDR